MSNSYDWENNKKIIKKYKKVVLQKVANKMVATKVQYRSSHFWILWKTLSLDYHWRKGKRIILKFDKWNSWLTLLKIDEKNKQLQPLEAVAERCSLSLEISF